MRILLVKTSSLGDVVHNLPVASDIRVRFPDAQIEWAVEEAFADIPRLHPAISGVIPVALRRWRRRVFSAQTWSEIAQLRARLRAGGYDEVIDTQGLVKSALVARMAPGRRSGLDLRSSREPLWPFFHRTYAVPWGQHAVERNRQLAAKALGYGIDSPPAYGIAPPAHLVGPDSWAGPLAPRAYAVLLHSTSAADKLWPEHQWVKLGDHLHHHGVPCVLPWGSDAERARSERIATLLRNAVVPPRLSLADAAWLLGRARIVFGVDTGLAHLATALGTPIMGLYCATDPAATGLYGAPLARNLGGIGRPPSIAEVIAAERQLCGESAAVTGGTHVTESGNR
jgi:heptosyltransferase-1